MNLDDLQQQIESIRRMPATRLSVEFSRGHLESLDRVLAEGRQKLERRLGELGATSPAAGQPPAAPSSDAPPAGRSRLGRFGARSLRRFMRSYRDCSRFLCAVLQKTHAGADCATAVIIALLLQNLEKQLWVLECRHIATNEALLAVTLFQSC